MADDREESAGSRGPTSVWERWREEGDVPFHEYCDVVPTPERARPEVDRDGWIRFTSGAARTVLRYTPPSIFVVTLVIVVTTVTSDGVFGPVAVLANLPIEGNLAVLGAGVVWVVVLAVLLNSRGLLPGLEFVEALFVYGLLAALLLDAAYWAAKVAVLEANGGATVDGGVFPSGSLVMLYVGGLLVYDGMVRTESTFSRLHEKAPPVVGPTSEAFESQAERSAAFERAAQCYRCGFLTDLREALDHRLPPEGSELPDAVPWDRPVRTAYVFAFWFVLPFLAASVVVDVDGSTLAALATDVGGLLALTVLAFFEVVVFFQFLVLVKFFNRLLTRHGPDGGGDDGFVLRYQPDHPDGYAGFHDLGKLATRVNVLLFLAGIYTVYRIYVAGLAVFPGPDAPAGQLLAWGFDFLGPHLVYIVTVVVWTYFSFWQLHKAMRRGRERRIEEHLEGDHDAELPDDKQYLKRAPVWPVDVRTFTGIVFGDLVPLLGLLVPFLP